MYIAVGLTIPVPATRMEEGAGLGVLQSTKMVLSQHHRGNLDFSKLIFPAHISNHIATPPRSFDTNKALAEDTSLHLSYYLSYKVRSTLPPFCTSFLFRNRSQFNIN